MQNTKNLTKASQRRTLTKKNTNYDQEQYRKRRFIKEKKYLRKR